MSRQGQVVLLDYPQQWKVLVWEPYLIYLGRHDLFQSNAQSRVLHGLVPLINMQKLHFLAFCQNCRTYIPEILYDTKTGNFTSGVDNCACEICKFLQCACADLCFVKWRNGNSFYLRQKAEILVVVTLDCLLSGANRLLKDLFD